MFARGKWYAPTNLMLGVWVVSLIGYAVFDQGHHPLNNTKKAVVRMPCWLLTFASRKALNGLSLLRIIIDVTQIIIIGRVTRVK